MAKQTHQADTGVLNRRTLARDNRHLARLIRSGMSVLDVGCGTGAITAGIAERVGPGGNVVGVDKDSNLLEIARAACFDCSNLHFHSADILSLPFDSEFDIVSAARTIQWVSDPIAAIAQLCKAARPGGQIVVLDYNHAEASWEPDPPPAFARFYSAFLAWREANQWDNRIASRLPELFAAAGLNACELLDSTEATDRTDGDFEPIAGIWLSVIDKLGAQIIAEGHLTRSALDDARTSYVSFVATTLQRQTLSLRTAIARATRITL